MCTENFKKLIDQLADLFCIVSEYWDIFGKKHVTSLETKQAILSAMGLHIETAHDIQKEIFEKRNKPWKDGIDPISIVSVNAQPLSIPVHIPVKDGEEEHLVIEWSVTDESGHKNVFSVSGTDCAISEVRHIENTRFVKILLHDSARRPLGYYHVEVESRLKEDTFPNGRNSIRKTSKIVIAPDTCYIPDYIRTHRTWGLSVNLYSIRSEQNFGIGDLSDLEKTAAWISELKGDFVGINPLHVLPNTRPFGISPYFPLSRLYKNFIYLDVEKIPEFTEAKKRGMLNMEDIQDRLDRFKKDSYVNYEGIARLKEEILRASFSLFYTEHYLRETQLGEDFKRFISEESYPLLAFATFMSIASHMEEEKKYNWREWPEEYHDLRSDRVEQFRKENEQEVLFHQYAQWLFDRQLEAVSRTMKEHGMKIGLYQDLAIGSVVGGSDVLSYPHVMAHDADVGAPPDDFSPEGQNWGFPPMIPEKLRETGYELFIQTMQKNMRHSGALRIDHALGLFRLFWIPAGTSPREGSYVQYPSEDLLRIIALESVRNRTVVIAEDLGTIGENVRETLQKFKMLSYRLFYFERNYPDPSFRPPEQYPPLALCAVTTHDLPTLSGYWEQRDLEVKRQLGHYSDDAQRERMDERNRDKQLILSALEQQNIPYAGSGHETRHDRLTPELCQAIYQYLARTPCRFLLVSLDDVIGTLDQQNMPGTVDSYPNWIQKTPLLLEEMITDKRFRSLALMFEEERSNPSES